MSVTALTFRYGDTRARCDHAAVPLPEDVETLRLKVGVVHERRRDLILVHDDEAHAISKAEVSLAAPC